MSVEILLATSSDFDVPSLHFGWCQKDMSVVSPLMLYLGMFSVATVASGGGGGCGTRVT